MTTRSVRTYRQQLGVKALEQEAARVFRRLVERGSYLAGVGGHLDGCDESGLFVVRNKHKKPVMMLKAGVLEGFAANDWITENGDGRWRLSAQGEAWLARRMAANDPYRTQHQIIGTRNMPNEQNSLRKLTVNLGESPLGRLRHRKGVDGRPLLSQEQYDAGERLRSDFEKARMSPRITSDITVPMTSSSKRRNGDSTKNLAMNDTAIAAKQRFFKALDAVGADLVDVLIEVCCHLRGLDEAEKQLRLPQRSGKIVLGIALTRLGQHYGMIVHTSAHQYKSPSLRHWGDESYRPKV